MDRGCFWVFTWEGNIGTLPIMLRAMRVEYPGAIYHVMDRGDRRGDIFVNDVDRQDILKTLAEACQNAAWQVHGSFGWYLSAPEHRPRLDARGPLVGRARH